MAELEPGVYEHYKSTEGNRKLYKVLLLAQLATEDSQVVVIYSPMYSLESSEGQPNFYARTLENFTEAVLVDGKSMPRFRRVS